MNPNFFNLIQCSRKENRRECLDLQNFVIQIPEVARTQPNRPPTKPSSYPLALVPGQFQEHYRQYSAAELLWVMKRFAMPQTKVIAADITILFVSFFADAIQSIPLSPIRINWIENFVSIITRAII